mmetsp:Transcript_81145/g.160860  ORF Transcript_81145/g.160860 Transcript_81145/m.160860 type:complete len:508 (-) Transcript_81145:94-1617(-)
MASRQLLRELPWDGLVFAAIFLQLWVSPYTKVEESFNLQASHDFLTYGTDLAVYDHKKFPGSVPRTFVGAWLAAVAVKPFAVTAELQPLALQYAVRIAVGIASAMAHARLRHAVARAWGESEARCLAVITALQFHLPFYMSRTLPNTFALAFANVAHAEAVSGSGYRCLATLSMAAAIFRCDLLVIIAPMGLVLLAQQRVNFFFAALACASAAMLAAASSISFDSVMWGRWVWPEFEVLWFNTAENKSSEWGTSPLLWYFYSALPRSLLGAIVLVPLGIAYERRARGLAVVAVGFVALYSALPHKELRFIFPALPLLNAVAAAGAARLLRSSGTDKKEGGQGCSGLWRALVLLTMAGLASASLLASAVFAVASASNYPGGVAMVRLHESEGPETPLSVHIGNLAATTGVSRFLQGHATWNYSKEEGLEPVDLAVRGFDRLLTEWPEVPGYTCHAATLGFERIRLVKPPAFPLEFVYKPKVFALRKSLNGSTNSCDSARIQRSLPLWS